jgi:hypothetical protein
VILTLKNILEVVDHPAVGRDVFDGDAQRVRAAVVTGSGVGEVLVGIHDGVLRDGRFNLRTAWSQSGRPKPARTKLRLAKRVKRTARVKRAQSWRPRFWFRFIPAFVTRLALKGLIDKTFPDIA